MKITIELTQIKPNITEIKIKHDTYPYKRIIVKTPLDEVESEILYDIEKYEDKFEPIE